jgi:SAM-dependent methyltransferase
MRMLRAIGDLRHSAFVRRVRYFGVRYRCPFCSSHLRKMLGFGLRLPVFARARVVGAGFREAILCPVCFSSDRERLMLYFLQERTDVLRAQTRLLHFAPEKHLEAVLRAAPGVSYWSADIAAPEVSVRLDITRIPFRRASFDAVVCSHVLEHVRDDREAMRELNAVLRPGGQAIIQVPIALGIPQTYENSAVVDPADREREFGQDDHVRLYTLDIVDRLRAAGFEVTTVYLGKDRGPVWADRVRVNPEEPIFLCRKPSAP